MKIRQDKRAAREKGENMNKIATIEMTRISENEYCHTPVIVFK
jgi:hypothetical protein